MYHGINHFGDIFTQYHGNVFFAFVMYVGRFFKIETLSFFRLYSILIVLLYAWGCRFFLPIPYATLALTFFGITSSFIFYSTNIIRQGLACTVFILAMAFWSKKRKKTSIALQILSFFSHTSAMLLILSHVFSNFFKNKKSLLFLTMPILPLPGFVLLRIFSKIGGLFAKIDSFSARDYSNSLVYLKIILLYGFGVLIHKILGQIKPNPHSEQIQHLFSIYVLMLCACLLTLPVLLISSRLIYYPSILLPIFFSYISKNFFSIQNKWVYFFCFIWTSFIYAIVVYNFKSTANQLGL